MNTNLSLAPSRYLKKEPKVIATAVLAFLVGTGGASSPEYIEKREERGYRYGSLVPLTPSLRSSTVDSFSQQISLLRAKLPVSVSTLAAIFGVSRQTIYDWQNGAIAAQQSQEMLRDILHAASLFADSDISVSGHLLKRPISNGQSLLDVCRSGASATNAARELIKIVLREREQQQVVSARLKWRNPQIDPSDFGSPSFNEIG